MLPGYQTKYQAVFEQEGFYNCKWDGRNCPYSWLFGAYKDGRPVTFEIPCVDVATQDGTKQGEEDVARILKKRRKEAREAAEAGGE